MAPNLVRGGNDSVLVSGLFFYFTDLFSFTDDSYADLLNLTPSRGCRGEVANPSSHQVGAQTQKEHENFWSTV